MDITRSILPPGCQSSGRAAPACRTDDDNSTRARTRSPTNQIWDRTVAIRHWIDKQLSLLNSKVASSIFFFFVFRFFQSDNRFSQHGAAVPASFKWAGALWRLDARHANRGAGLGVPVHDARPRSRATKCGKYILLQFHIHDWFFGSNNSCSADPAAIGNQNTQQYTINGC